MVTTISEGDGSVDEDDGQDKKSQGDEVDGDDEVLRLH